jgi:hypothetical protein
MSPVELSGVHLLLTYKCLYECDHCFVWSSPGSKGTMTLANLEDIIRQAHEVPSVKRVYFEGGEPFLFYPLMLRGIELARRLSLEAGVVTNAYFAADDRAADLWLRPLAELGISDLSLSTDSHHGTGEENKMVRRAKRAAKRLGVPVGVIEIESVEELSCSAPKDKSKGQLCFRGRAAAELAGRVRKRPWRTFDACPEEPPDISRVHVDPYGNVMFCQGVAVGNAWKKSLKSIMSDLDPQRHPVIGPLTDGGPAELARRFGVRPERSYADACHLCYEVRRTLRKRQTLKGVLVPDQLYGVMPEDALKRGVARSRKSSPKKRRG